MCKDKALYEYNLSDAEMDEWRETGKSADEIVAARPHVSIGQKVANAVRGGPEYEMEAGG